MVQCKAPRVDEIITTTANVETIIKNCIGGFISKDNKWVLDSGSTSWATHRCDERFIVELLPSWIDVRTASEKTRAQEAWLDTPIGIQKGIVFEEINCRLAPLGELSKTFRMVDFCLKTTQNQ